MNELDPSIRSISLVQCLRVVLAFALDETLLWILYPQPYKQTTSTGLRRQAEPLASSLIATDTRNLCHGATSEINRNGRQRSPELRHLRHALAFHVVAETVRMAKRKGLE